MTKGLIFWVLFMLCIVFGLLDYKNPNPTRFGQVFAFGGSLVLLILLGLLGWVVFGPAIK